MRRFGLWTTSIMLCAASLFGAADGTIQDEATGFSFPSEISFQSGGKEYHLQATGVATRVKFFVKVYSIASYLQDPAAIKGGDKFQAIINADQAKQLTLKWFRSVPVDKMQEAFRESFGKVLSNADLAKLKPEIDNFLTFFNQEAEKGSEYDIRWIPGGTIEVFEAGKSVGKIANMDFAKAVWSIWFGETNVVKRDRLVSLVK